MLGHCVNTGSRAPLMDKAATHFQHARLGAVLPPGEGGSGFPHRNWGRAGNLQQSCLTVELAGWLVQEATVAVRGESSRKSPLPGFRSGRRVRRT